MGKVVIVTTYAIRRGFRLLDPRVLNTDDHNILVSMLDGMEKVSGARPITLREMQETDIKVDLMVTGTGAVNFEGVRFGKGHGFFDLEWAMLSSIGVLNNDVPCVALVHDCQVLDEELAPQTFDTVCNIIVTPTRTIHVGKSNGATPKPNCGILWGRLQPGMFEDIPPLQELKEMQGA